MQACALQDARVRLVEGGGVTFEKWTGEPERASAAMRAVPGLPGPLLDAGAEFVDKLVERRDVPLATPPR